MALKYRELSNLLLIVCVCVCVLVYMDVHVAARPGDELKVEKEVMESHTMPNMKISVGGSPYILSPSHDKVEHGSLTCQESLDILVSITCIISALYTCNCVKISTDFKDL